MGLHIARSLGPHYIGSTTDLDRRLAQHRHGRTYSTRPLGQTLELETLAAARRPERQLKAKKNPALALWMLEQRRLQLRG